MKLISGHVADAVQYLIDNCAEGDRTGGMLLLFLCLVLKVVGVDADSTRDGACVWQWGFFSCVAGALGLHFQSSSSHSIS